MRRRVVELKTHAQGTSLTAQWLGFCPSIAGGPGFNPWWGNYDFKSHAKKKNKA